VAPRYLLDTNTASFIIRGALQERLAALSPADLAISAITEGELLFGLARKPDAAALHRKVHSFLLHVVVLPWDSEAARHYGPLRGQLEAAGQPLGALDLLIAAHALAAGCILVTNDRAFARVDGLAVEDWLAA
jgi:tRNA(fMet)-specific endonuclease VapC